jgi:hypothetical protein
MFFNQTNSGKRKQENLIMILRIMGQTLCIFVFPLRNLCVTAQQAIPLSYTEKTPQNYYSSSNQ